MSSTAAGTRDEVAFLEAWRRGVMIAGVEHFGAGNGVIGESKWDLAPRVEEIERWIGTMSSGEATFIAAMVSFYNARVGGKMLADMNLGSYGLADVTAGLDPDRRRVIADLLLSYAGW